MVNSPLIRPYLLEGVALGGTLDSHVVDKASCAIIMVPSSGTMACCHKPGKIPT